jgi:peptide deformylase
MAPQPIIQNGHKTLRQIAAPVSAAEFGTPKLASIIADMFEALKTQHDGVDLAAPQIAVSKRIFVVSPLVLTDKRRAQDTPLIYINPVITKRSLDKKKMDEGCLSVRPLYGKVRRSTRATVTAFDEHGNEFSITGTGLLAQIFQHEIDHLDGILFIDHATDIVALGESEEPLVK